MRRKRERKEIWEEEIGLSINEGGGNGEWFRRILFAKIWKQKMNVSGACALATSSFKPYDVNVLTAEL